MSNFELNFMGIPQSGALAHPFGKRILISIFLLSASLISYQLLLMQIFSIVQWYHFAFMVISISLFGFGAAGTFLSLFRTRLIGNSSLFIPFFTLISGLLQIIAVFLSQLSFIKFDSYLVFADYSQVINLIITYLILFLPFFFGALAIGLSFFVYIDRIGKIYFSNLLGSGFGGIIILFLFWILLPEKISSIISLFAILSALILFPKSYTKVFTLILLAAIAFAIFFFIQPYQLSQSQFKNISKTLNLPDAKIIFQKNSPYGLIEVVSSPVLRYSQGLSLAYKEDIPHSKAIFVNGDWFGAIVGTANGTGSYLHYTTEALPYSMKEREKILILNAGSGTSIAQAISSNVKGINAVEQNTLIISLMKNEFAMDSDSLFHKKNLAVSNIDSRTFLKSDTCKYDLIMLPYTNSFGGGVGLYALQEQYLLTLESFEEMFDRLKNDGVICVSCWIDYPFRNPLKIISTIVEMLNKKNVKEFRNHIAAVKSWGTITFVIKRLPLSSEEVNNVRTFCDSLMFDPIILPDYYQAEMNKYNLMEDEKFFEYIDDIFSGHREDFYKEYDFNIEPANDDQPYFSQFIKLRSLAHLKDIYGTRNAPFMEIGYLIVLLTFVQVVILAFVLILLPLRKTNWKGIGKLKTIFYFGTLGLGYMFVEIIFIQKFILYFGKFIYAALAVISLMLICSGAGSYFSTRINKGKSAILFISGLIFAILFLYTFLLTPILQSTIGYNIFLKMIITFFLIAVPSFLMGMPFPIGLKLISTKNKSVVFWAWGINGCFSVIASPLAVIVAVELGFSVVMLISGVLYLSISITK